MEYTSTLKMGPEKPKKHKKHKSEKREKYEGLLYIHFINKLR